MFGLMVLHHSIIIQVGCTQQWLVSYLRSITHYIPLLSGNCGFETVLRLFAGQSLDPFLSPLRPMMVVSLNTTLTAVRTPTPRPYCRSTAPADRLGFLVG